MTNYLAAKTVERPQKPFSRKGVSWFVLLCAVAARIVVKIAFSFSLSYN